MLYVAPNGNDHNPGTKAKPLATLAEALTRPSGPKQIFLRGGFYSLGAPCILGPSNSGTQIRAEKGETPVLSGGTQVRGWKEITPGRWQVPWEGPVEQLYLGQERRYRPTLPKSGYYRVAGDTLPGERGYAALVYTPGDVNPSWSNLAQIEVECYQIWTMARMRVKSLDSTQHLLQFTGQTIGKEPYQALSKGKRYRLVNVKEALDTPGEWYWDAQQKTLTYLSKKGENPNRLGAFVPHLPTLLVIEGAQDITLEGLTFAHSAWLNPPEGNSFYQAEVNIPDTIRVTQSQRILFERCTVRHTGNWAITFGSGAKDCAVRRSLLIDLGAGGVRIGEQGLQKDPAKQTERITVEDCLLAEGGRLHPAAVGVWIGHSAYNKILHNEIVDFYYTGISPGWSWGYGESGAHHNELGWNHIHQIGQGVLSDMGGIYTLGVSPGTTIHHNHIHDISSFDYGGWGIYFDEGSTGIVAQNNLVYQTTSAPFHQHYGRENIVRNNILALGTEAQLMRTRAEEHLSFTLEHNIIFWREGPLLGSNWSGTPGKNFVLRNNLYWNTAGMQPTLGDKDTSSQIIDPRFAAPERGDFRLLPGSPAMRLGFVPFDLSTAGPRGRKPYANSALSAFPPVRRTLLAAEIHDNFENDLLGAVPGGENLSVSLEPGTGATIQVAMEGTRKCLKFTDASRQKARYNPHLYYHPHFTRGALTARFDLRLETGAVLYHEWRDGSSPYRVGPSLRIESGSLRVGNRELDVLPLSVWLTVEIAHTLGSGIWQLAIKLPGRVPPRRWPGLTCLHGKEMQSLRWWGFVADADGPGVFYIDNLDVSVKGDG